MGVVVVSAVGDVGGEVGTSTVTAADVEVSSGGVSAGSPEQAAAVNSAAKPKNKTALGPPATESSLEITSLLYPSWRPLRRLPRPVAS